VTDLSEKLPTPKPSRFRLLGYPLSLYSDLRTALYADYPMRKAAKETRYPLRAMRYWWAACAIASEAKRLGRPPLVVDIGCEKGRLPRFASKAVSAQWVGVDILRRLEADAHYERIVECDLDKPLPMERGQADVVVCLHVLEHLARPEFTMAEFAKLLRPGGLLLAATPVAPRWVARFHERRFARRDNVICEGYFRHINAFWPGRLRRLVKDAGLATEFAGSSYVFRWSGNFLENHAAWTRFNQILGALLPSLGQEFCMECRAP
jgi:SAM-dependent methyltransferase